MDIEKLIEQLHNFEACAYGYHINGEVLGIDCSEFEQVMVDAATALSTLQTENEKLRAELEQKSKLIAQQAAERARGRGRTTEGAGMKEYIKREDAIQSAKHAWAKGLEPSQYIECLPTADVAEVRHGRWEEADWVELDVHGLETTRIPKAGLRCSRCSNVFKKELLWKDNYCPNCGARMDKE